jgi:hypothetical protein
MTPRPLVTSLCGSAAGEGGPSRRPRVPYRRPVPLICWAGVACPGTRGLKTVLTLRFSRDRRGPPGPRRSRIGARGMARGGALARPGGRSPPSIPFSLLALYATSAGCRGPLEQHSACRFDGCNKDLDTAHRTFLVFEFVRVGRTVQKQKR